ncbi:alpha-amylase family protein [Deinococcus yavapaiensis]|uniref:Amylosucrase n=1 Tax=Deinococcus yavapaiensis KR-236 TaxID=694435 RepID=A0A318S4A1_9DEIO|nr:alpha-amylase family protein [Deinococcus yavapaiensis]PYE51199.1 amylosucrase [Deinococcus yavapaiensis KR-236]
MKRVLSASVLNAIRDAFPDDDRELEAFQLRYERYAGQLFDGVRAVYPDAEDLEERLLEVLLHAWHERPADLKRLDSQRLLSPDWLQTPDVIGYVAYADRFADTLAGVLEKVEYIEELGARYFHLMPLLKPRRAPNDGGYAVQDYRSVREDLGSMHDLSRLAKRLRRSNISLCLDLVLNHVAREHEWAERARRGEAKYQRYFHMFADRTLPDQYERTLPEVFPDFAPGNFTFDDESGQWVWTTFNSYQWDLDWSNPDVFLEFADLILFLANRGVEVFRLDAIAFIWKRMGTDCQNQPEVHAITQALRAVTRIVAPAVAFKAEAIVAPQQLLFYLGRGAHHGKVSDLAYHNSLMVQIWSSLASRDIRLFEAALKAFPPKPTNTTWGMYVRCHDDIGWAISDEDAAKVGVTGEGHRRFLSDFYSSEFPGSFARGLVFQHNPRTGDRRISGSGASLAGLEIALERGDEHEVHLALERLMLAHAIVLGFGGVPLLYMGDELAMLNDYGYVDVPEHAEDNRWVHRPHMDWARAELRHDETTIAGRMYQGLKRLIEARRNTPHFHAAVESRVIDSPNPHVLMLERVHPLGTLVATYNFSEHAQALPSWPLHARGLSDALDRITRERRVLGETLVLPPYGRAWLTPFEDASTRW